MPKIKEKMEYWTYEVVYCDKTSESVTLPYFEARQRFYDLVDAVLHTHSLLREINLYDNCHRLYKSYIQKY